MESFRQFDDGAYIDLPLVEDGAVVDLTGATAYVRFKPPAVPAFDRACTIPNPPSGVARYEFQPGELGWWGLWRAMVNYVAAGGRPNLHSRMFTFEVEPILGPPPIYLRPDPTIAVFLSPPVTIS